MAVRVSVTEQRGDLNIYDHDVCCLDATDRFLLGVAVATQERRAAGGRISSNSVM